MLSSTIMLLDNFAKQLSFDLHLVERLAPDSDGAYTVRVDASFEIKMEWLDPGFYLETVIARAKGGWSEETMLLLLLGNLFGQGTGHGALALDGTGENILLTLTLPYEMAYVEFREWLEELANYTEYWKMKIEQLSASSKGEA
jgi:Tir chaperone protein (CesT) family